MGGDDDISTFKAKYDKLGTTCVEFWRTKTLGQSSVHPEIFHEDLDAVPEKALKGRPLAVATR
jgi:hypothetical protein